MKRLALLAIMIGLLAACSPQDQAEADVMRMRAAPTATLAAIQNEAERTRQEIVAPVKATAEAASILANNDQRIDEDKHQQALRHAGEMAAQTLSNTQRLAAMNVQQAETLEEIQAEGAAKVAASQADAQKSTAYAWRETGVSIGIMLAAVIALGGVAIGITLWSWNRAMIFKDESGRMVIVKGNTVMLPSRTEGPALVIRAPSMPEKLGTGVRLMLGKPVAPLATEVLMPVGPHQEEVTSRDQTVELIRAAMSGKKQAASEIQQAASASVAQMFGGQMAGLLGGRLPNEPLLINAPDQVKAFEDSLGGEG
jgi:hypothetical protein